MKYIQKTLAAAFVLVTSQIYAQLELPALFGKNMVLQQNAETSIWGSTDPKASVQIDASWMEKVVKIKSEKDGKWKTSIPTPEAGGPYEITITSGQSIKLTNVMIGEVWLCAGQSNMEMPMRGFRGEPVDNSNDDIIHSTNPNIRMISVPRKSTTIPQGDFEGSWASANPETVSEFSATAYYFARLVNELTNVPIGLIDVSYGGSNVEAWMNQDMLVPYEEIKIPETDGAIGEKNRTPTVLYNGMLTPVIGYTIKGAIWYQGESNAERPLKYEELFPDMVKLWRAKWGQGIFPFYFTQIAPFDYDAFYSEEKPWFANSAYLRDAQRKSQYTIPRSGMASLLDVGDMKTIHPRNKRAAGERLAYLALVETYGLKGFGYATPDYDELNVEDTLVTITFKNLPNGITSYGQNVTAFEVAGEDQIFYPAKCKVRRKSVQVWSDKVNKPIAIRYAFSNEGPAQLFSTEGLPVSSFRTDDWDPEEVNFSK
ncbi:MAG: sialate O-acetylesterase [Cyclobacteriaceae bacterium]